MYSMKMYMCVLWYRKRELICRKDLVIEWRPLYRLVHNAVYSPFEHHGLVLLPQYDAQSLLFIDWLIDLID